MSSLKRYVSVSSALVMLASSAGAMVPLVAPAPVMAQTNFSDVAFGYWARPFIERLAERNIIRGFPDGTFRPNEPVTRAQFAAIVNQAFSAQPTRRFQTFRDLPSGFWANEAIEAAYVTGFLSGYPDGTFAPTQQIPKVQALVSLANGLQLQSSGDVNQTLSRYRDGAQIPDYARPSIAAATQKGLVVNYPNINFFDANQVATRADIAAFVYQALVNQGQLSPLDSSMQASNYVVPGVGGTTPPTTPGTQPPQQMLTLARNTQLPVRYPGSQTVKFVVVPGETVPATLEIAANVTNANGVTVIPRGSLVEGRLVPINVVNSTAQGTQFVADNIRVGDRTYSFSATSSPFVPTSPQAVNTSTLEGVLPTAAARTILGPVLGGNLTNVLFGVLGGSSQATPPTNQQQIIVIDPRDLNLTTQADLQVAATSPGTQPTTPTGSLQVAQGTILDVKSEGPGNEKYALVPGETVAVTVQTVIPILNSSGDTLVPVGSRLEGQLQPVQIDNQRGVRFVANRLTIGDRSYTVNAQSRPFAARAVGDLTSADLQGSLQATTAASSVLQGTSTSLSLGGIIGQVIGGNVPTTNNQVVIIDPRQMGLELRAPVTLQAAS
ncbi:hypothetical protein GS597_19975 [Synechococcales cyanobacterium C]|uniref:SLH domain-containing protein n=1 Tax=Petrachloros mirabilis ULC683 TaxID=2781853 RepID=A0A8K2A0V1_9CYAN|nr:S-layer homology domain-containing protein [Petrachloros mirabilis]NCJ08744.1 hypothetical protein [Petrachloros mirabilis ULC683]